ncbi:acetyl-CoA carboxylase biotin carboxylase subunit family protein [Neptuniibacter sp.]|uniref:ATP-grasp domain-containing protein n=1 Tax=Neptuniibacter sp. TaxID=1962643 RepID=UPI002601DA6E|nr:ATP-grasp domain-containing protein [Neptuniibacter sp.]MCP4595906.1 ATP-grasp domain-containing protein [Neptuniibacter sp.]
MQKKAIYIIGAGPLAIKTFSWTKELGLLTIVTDQNPDAPGILHADFHAQLSAADQSGSHEKFIASLPSNITICGVYCGNEIGAPLANQLRQHLGLPYASPESILTAADKVLMKGAWLEKGIHTPPCTVMKNINDINRSITGKDETFIIKPSLGSGSRGVQAIHDGDDLEKIWQAALEPVDFEGSVLLEPYIEGRSIDANGVFFKNKYYPAGTLEKYITDFPECLPLGGNDPADIPTNTSNEVHRLMEHACRAINLTEGPVKGDFILSNDGTVYVLEVAPRLHGDVTTCNTLPFGSGCNALKFMFKCWTENFADEDLLNQDCSGYALWWVLCLPPGLSYHQHFANQLEEDNGTTVVWFNHKHDENVHSYSSTREIPGYICAYGNNKTEAEKNMARTLDKLIPSLPSYCTNQWYKNLGLTLQRFGISPQSCGYKC